MKRKLFIVSLIAIFFVCIFSLTAPTIKAEELTDEEKVTQEINNITVPSTAIIDFPVVYESVYDSTIEWESSNYDLLNVPQNGGWVKVTRPTDTNTTVVLTVTITNGQASKSKSFEVTVIKGTTLTNTYNIRYVLNGGTNSQNNPSTYKVGSSVELSNPTKGRVEFLGWYDNEQFEGDAITSLPEGLSGDYTLYAKWAVPVVESIKVVSNTRKTVYNAFESFDTTGLKVVAIYNDDVTEKEITLDELTYSTDPLTGDVTSVKVAYEQFEVEIPVTVNKLKYDLSKVNFNDKTVTYNGQEQSIDLPTNLPEGLVAQVVGSATNATTSPVLVKLVFTSYDQVNYEKPADLEAYLTVNKAHATVTVNTVAIKVGDELPEFTYQVIGLFGNDKLEGEFKAVHNITTTSNPGTFEVSGEGLTSDNYEIEYVSGQLIISAGVYDIVVEEKDLTVTYNGQNQMFEAIVKDESGQTIEIESLQIHYAYEGNEFKGATNAGKYQVIVTYTIGSEISGSETFTFEILKAVYDLSEIEFNDKTVVYNGSVQGIEIEGQLPDGVEVNYTEGLTEVGSKVIVASFTGDTQNYEEIVVTLEATLTVTPKELSENMFEALPDQAYTGSAIEPSVNGSFVGQALVLGQDFTVTYQNNVEQGTAYAVVKGQGNFTGEVTLTFEIGDSDLVKVKDAKEELEESFDATETVEEVVLETTNGAKVTWFSTSTAVSFNNETGEVRMIKTNEEQVVLVYALIVINDSAEYTSFEFIVPAQEAVEDEEDSELVKITDVNELTDGTVIVIASHDEKMVLGELNSDETYFTAIETKDTIMEGAINITLVKAEGGYKLKLDDGRYVYYTGSKNTIKVGSEQSDNSDVWSISVVNGLFAFKNVKDTERYLQFNSNSGQERFSAYKNTQKNLVVYAFSSVSGGGSTPDQPDQPEVPTHEHTACPTCGKCTAEDCTGASEDKCTGHEEPEQPVGPQEITISEAIAKGSAQEDNVNTSEKYIIKGTVKEIKNSTFGNMVITDGSSEILVYGVYSADGSTRYDALAVKPVVGDQVTFVGVLGQYNGTAQMKNGWLTAHTVHEHEYEEGKCSICEAKDPNYQEPAEPDQPEQPDEPEQPVTGNSISVDLSAQGYQNQQKISTVELDGATLIFAKSTGSNDPAYYTTGTAVRLYAKNTLTITSTKTITKVVFEYGSGDGTLEITVKDGSFATNTWTGSATSVEFTFGANVTSGQRRIKTVTVYFAEGSSTEPEQPEVPTHEHTLCEECGLCTAEDCTGVEADKCQGHEEVEQPENPTDAYTLVTDASQLVAGAKIVIVAKGNNVAISTTQNSNNRGEAPATVANGAVTFGDDVQVLTLEVGTTSGTWAFNTGSGYLYAAGGTGKNNYLKTKTALDLVSSWTITINSNGSATVKCADTTVVRNTLQYNKSSKLFSCYASGQAEIEIYILN